jgi:hypothetical protein
MHTSLISMLFFFFFFFLSLSLPAHPSSSRDYYFRRARSEHASALKAMQARHAKGLLTPSEQVRLAEEMAAMQLDSNSHERDCLIV